MAREDHIIWEKKLKDPTMTNKKLGRPIEGAEKKKTVAITIQPKTWEKLNLICKKLKISKSEWIENKINHS